MEDCNCFKMSQEAQDAIRNIALDFSLSSDAELKKNNAHEFAELFKRNVGLDEVSNNDGNMMLDYIGSSVEYIENSAGSDKDFLSENNNIVVDMYKEYKAILECLTFDND